MFTSYMTNLDPLKMEDQLSKLLNSEDINGSRFDNHSGDFATNHETLYKHVISVIPHKNSIIDWNINQNFVGQPFLEITGTSNSNFRVEFYGGEETSSPRCNQM